MRMHVWVLASMMLATVYVLPIAVGLFVSSPRTAVMPAVASYSGFYASVWSALRPLLAALTSVAPQFEVFTVLILSLLVGSLQVALLGTVGTGCANCSDNNVRAVPFFAARSPTRTFKRCQATVGSTLQLAR